MANDKVLIDGIAYTITGGKTLIGGTSYSIPGGKTLIGGTAKTIEFRPPQTIKALFSSVSSSVSPLAGGVNGSSTSVASFVIPLGVTALYYMFVFFNGYMSIRKVGFTGGTGLPTTNTVLKEVSSSYCKINVSSANNQRKVSVSNNGTSDLSAYGATIVALVSTAFSGYRESEIDSIFSNITLTRVVGRNSSSAGNIRANASTYANGKYVFAAYSSYMGISHWTSATTFETIWGNNSSNAALVFRNGSYCQLSINGTSAQSAYGASIVTAPY